MLCPLLNFTFHFTLLLTPSLFSTQMDSDDDVPFASLNSAKPKPLTQAKLVTTRKNNLPPPSSRYVRLENRLILLVLFSHMTAYIPIIDCCHQLPRPGLSPPSPISHRLGEEFIASKFSPKHRSWSTRSSFISP